jgi:hypothetical protein
LFCSANILVLGVLFYTMIKCSDTKNLWVVILI